MVAGQSVKKGVTARSLHTHAKAFFDASELVHQSAIADPLPKCFLWGRTVELFLKSFLLAQGLTVPELKRRFGHDLDGLFQEAQRRGLSKLIGADVKHSGIVRILNFDYQNKRLEYREAGGNYFIPDADLTQTFIRRLQKGIDCCLNKSGI